MIQKILLILIELSSLYIVKIEMNDDFILWYTLDAETQKYVSGKLINKSTKMLTTFNETLDINDGFLLELDHFNGEKKNTRIISSKVIKKDTTFLGFPSIVYETEYELTNYLNGRGTARVITEGIYSEIDILEKYMGEFTNMLPFLKHKKCGNDKKHYKLQSTNVTYGMNDVMNKVSKIQETSKFSKIGQIMIDKSLK